MKKLFYLLMVMAVMPLLMTTGCKDEVTTTEFDTLTEYAKANSLDLTDVLSGWVASAAGFNVDTTDFSVPDYYIMDFRGAADFDNGHIKDAHNVAFANVLTEAANAGGKPIMCVCYTGQTAARATGFLRMAGYSAKSLKWGMSAWNATFTGKWDANAVDFTSPNWVTTGDPVVNTEFSAPTFTSDKATGAEILTDRLNAALSLPWTISKTDVLTSPDSYFVNNKWSIDSWNAFGHVKGAYRIDEELNIDGLKYLNPDEDMVTYCYTGQTSAITTAWLNVMGYDKAKSLLFGANGVVHTALKGSNKAAKTWRGEASGSAFNFAYYDKDGVKHD